MSPCTEKVGSSCIDLDSSDLAYHSYSDAQQDAGKVMGTLAHYSFNPEHRLLLGHRAKSYLHQENVKLLFGTYRACIRL